MNPSGALCNKMARKINQPSQYGKACTPGNQLAAMRLFAIVEVRVDGVFEQMHDAVAGHDQDGGQARTHLEALGGHLKQGNSH